MRFSKIMIVCSLLLAACATNERFYQQGNYQSAGVVSAKPFNQVAAECKYNTTRHNALWDTYELEIPRFKACMEMNGYRYTEGMVVQPLQPQQPAPLVNQQDVQARAALYQ